MGNPKSQISHLKNWSERQAGKYLNKAINTLNKSKDYHTEDESDFFILKIITLREKSPNLWFFSPYLVVLPRIHSASEDLLCIPPNSTKKLRIQPKNFEFEPFSRSENGVVLVPL